MFALAVKFFSGARRERAPIVKNASKNRSKCLFIPGKQAGMEK